MKTTLPGFPRRPSAVRAMTIPELLLVMTIVALLALLFMGNYQRMRNKAQTVDVITKLKGMWNGLSSYVNDNQTWPQEPDDEEAGGGSSEQLWSWWKKELKPYGLHESDWYTNAHLNRLNTMMKQSGGKAVKMDAMGVDEELKFPSIMPGSFDPGPTEPFRYGNQPWVTETGEYHGDDGIYSILPSGAISKMMTLSQMNSARSGAANSGK